MENANDLKKQDKGFNMKFKLYRLGDFIDKYNQEN